MCDDIHIFVCHMTRFTCCLKASSQGGSFPIVLYFCTAKLLRNLLRSGTWVLCLMDRKGEPRTLEQQSELRLYTDYPLKPVSQIFPNLWFLIIWILPSCQFPKRTKWIHIQSKNVQREESCKLFGGTFSHISCTRINLCEFLVAVVVAHSIHSSLMNGQNKHICVFRFDYDSSFHRIFLER